MVYGLSDGDIYVQGTKDRLNRTYTSQTRKSWLGIGYGKSSDYVNTQKERYAHTRLYGDAGVQMDADGKLRVEGADIQTNAHVFLRGKQGLEILPGVENSSHYEDHQKSGLTASFSGGSVFAGIETKRNQIATQTVSNVGSIINAPNGGIFLEGDTVVSMGTKFNSGLDGINVVSERGAVFLDARNIYTSNESNEVSRAGFFANASFKDLSAAAGIEAAYSSDRSHLTVILPERNVMVTDGKINFYAKNGDVLLQGDFGARDDVIAFTPNGKVFIKDSTTETLTSSENMNARVALGLSLYAGGIKDTLKSYSEYLKNVKILMRNIDELPKVLGVGKDLIKGKGLIESLQGREKSIETWNMIFKGIDSGGVSATGGLTSKF